MLRVSGGTLAFLGAPSGGHSAIRGDLLRSREFRYVASKG